MAQGEKNRNAGVERAAAIQQAAAEELRAANALKEAESLAAAEKRQAELDQEAKDAERLAKAAADQKPEESPKLGVEQEPVLDDKDAVKLQEEAETPEQRQLRELQEQVALLTTALASKQSAEQVTPGPAFFPQSSHDVRLALQAQADLEAKKNTKKNVPGGPIFRVPVLNEVTNQFFGYRYANGRGQTVDPDTGAVLEGVQINASGPDAE